MEPEDFAQLFELEKTLWWFVGMRSITETLLEPFLSESQSRMALDNGCGTGENLDFLERYSGDGTIFGIDISKDAIDFSRRRDQPLLAQASATKLPFPDLTFDLVTSFDVLVQIPGEGCDIDAINEMSRVLKPGGIVFVRVAAHSWMRAGHDEAMRTQRRYSLKELVGKVESAGLTVLRQTYANSILFPAAILKRCLLERVGFAKKGSDVRPLAGGSQIVNRALGSILSWEASILRTGANLPTGLSAICIAQKPG